MMVLIILPSHLHPCQEVKDEVSGSGSKRFQGSLVFCWTTPTCSVTPCSSNSLYCAAIFSADINMLTDPYNQLQPSLHDFAAHAVQLEASRNRTVLHDCPRIDKHIYRSSVASLPADIQGAVYGVSTLSIADQGYIHELDNHQSSLCVSCGNCKSSVPHIIFDCDHPK